MKTLILYYSRDGHTEKLCKDIAKKLKADVEEIIDLKDRKRLIIGWVIAGKDALTKKWTEIKFKKDCAEYDLIILGTPTWVSSVTPAIRTYLIENKKKLLGKKLAFICTFGGNAGHVFKDMQELSKKPIATLALKDKDIDANEVSEKVEEFCKKLPR